MPRQIVNLLLVLALFSSGAGLSHAMHVSAAHTPHGQATHEHHGCCHHHHEQYCGDSDDDEPTDDNKDDHQHEHDCAVCKMLASGFVDIAHPCAIVDTPRQATLTLAARTRIAAVRTPGPLPPRGPPHCSI